MSSRHYVCSDIHLGLPASESEFFYEQFLPQLRNGDTLILLGDILDFWISSHEIQLQTVINNWNDLHESLREVRGRGVKIKYIPGNHDSFVFYVESHGAKDFNWSQWLFKSCEVFFNVFASTKGHRLGAVCDIHYPLYRATIGDKKFLFTHGHWFEIVWKVLSGDPEHKAPEGRLPKFWVVAKALMTCAVHSIAPDIRRMYTRFLEDEDDAIALTRRVEDVSYCVLAEVLRGKPYNGPWGTDPERAPTLDDMYQLSTEIRNGLTDGLKDQVGGASVSPRNRDRQACIERGRKLLEQWLRKDPPETQVERVKNLLRRQAESYNYTLYRSDFGPTVEYEKLAAFSDFETLVFGHFHKPRASATAVDEGCMLKPNKTTTIRSFLVIEPDGTMIPSWVP